MKSDGKRKPPRAGMGRKLGSKNRFSVKLLDDFVWMYQQLGGRERGLVLLKKSKALEKQFIFHIIPAIGIPKPIEVSGPGGDPMRVLMVDRAHKPLNAGKGDA